MEAAWQQFINTVWQIASESAFWVIISLVVGGLVHEFLPSSRFRNLLNRRGQTAMGGSILLGACLPICSCGVIPLAISLYKSGIRLGPVMAFAAATPIINPAAVILSLALLGPQITLAYVALGLALPYVLGFLTDRFGEPLKTTDTDCCDTVTACCSTSSENRAPPVELTVNETTTSRALRGIRWGLTDLGPTIAFYMTIGVVLAGLLAAFLPASWADTYLRDNTVTALLAAGILGASIYVCAVAHIPLVATLLAAGAAPGISIVFLVTGTATNLPELIALYKTIGRRTVILYVSALIIGAIVAGIAVNAWLMPGFTPVFDPVRSLELLETGERLQPTIGGLFRMLATVLLAALALLGTWRWFAGRIARRRAATAGTGDSCCSG